MVTNFFLFLWMLVEQLWIRGLQQFLVAVVAGTLLAAAAWWLAHFVALGFNRQFSFNAQHHVYCGIAAVITLLFTILFFAMQYTADAARALVNQWEVAIRSDSDWARDTFIAAYEAAYNLRDASGKQLEDFTNYPHPSRGGHLIPLNEKLTQSTVAEVYVDAAIKHFRKGHPFLSKVLWARGGVAPDMIKSDMERYFHQNPGGTYNIGEAIALAGREIRSGLVEQAPRVVLISRILLVVAFLLIQAVTFGLLIRAALANIKEGTAARTS
jgi:hypothetical protein